jgi:hypothetical protein
MTYTTQTVVTDGRRSSVAHPNVIAPWELGPYAACDELVDGVRCGEPSVQLAVVDGRFGLGRCAQHRMPDRPKDPTAA